MTQQTEKPQQQAMVGRRRVDRQRQSELMTQIEEIVLREGFLDLNMDELTSRLHCSKSTLYGVAGNKQTLVVKTVKHFFENATRRIEEATTAETDCRRKVKVYLRGVGREMGRNSTQFYLDMVTYPPAAEVYAVNSAAAARRVREIIDQGVKSGQFRAVDAAFASELVVLAIDGVQSGRLLAPTGLTAGEAFAEIADILLDGLQYQSPRQLDA
ncbi:TetR/AcrR family transcriptional regulator [Pseudarthrobacter sp. AG30]|uniref:TetR/AcrR family transcriptional regulator n=1 Tax=Pseudarthrobacter sp. AG30 TaxID=2249742 RepID=UPI0019810C77|nr:TetR/AcrR family transcriptional regulator [Pseudarthrobacter sp. AG30]